MLFIDVLFIIMYFLTKPEAMGTVFYEGKEQINIF
jgi:hypothetical protein